MLKQFLAKHFGLVELNEEEKELIFNHCKNQIRRIIRSGDIMPEGVDAKLTKHYCSRLTALGISFTYNKRTGIK